MDESPPFEGPYWDEVRAVQVALDCVLAASALDAGELSEILAARSEALWATSQLDQETLSLALDQYSQVAPSHREAWRDLTYERVANGSLVSLLSAETEADLQRGRHGVPRFTDSDVWVMARAVDEEPYTWVSGTTPLLPVALALRLWRGRSGGGPVVVYWSGAGTDEFVPVIQVVLAPPAGGPPHLQVEERAWPAVIDELPSLTSSTGHN